MLKQILLITIICVATLSAQDWWGTGIVPKVARPYTSFWIPTFVDTTYNQLANTMLIDYNAAKGDTLKTVGGNRLNFEYTRVWGTIPVSSNFPESPSYYWFSPNPNGYVNAWGKQTIYSRTGDYDPQVFIWFDSLFFQNYGLLDTVKITFDFFRSNPLTGTGAVITFSGFIPSETASFVGGNNEWTSVDTTLHNDYFDDFYDFTNLNISAGSCDSFYIANLNFVFSGVDSVSGSQYTITINETKDSLMFYHDYLVGWKQKDKDTVWVRSDMDSVFIPDFYIEPEPDHFYIVNKDGGKLLGKSNYAIKFKD